MFHCILLFNSVKVSSNWNKTITKLLFKQPKQFSNDNVSVADLRPSSGLTSDFGHCLTFKDFS